MIVKLAVVLVDDLHPEPAGGDRAREIAVHLLAERVHLALLDQAGRLHDQVGGEEVEHPALVLLTPTAPVAARAPLAGDRPGGRLAFQLVVLRIRRRLLGARDDRREQDK
jgi:hypothetical protein